MASLMIYDVLNFLKTQLSTALKPPGAAHPAVDFADGPNGGDGMFKHDINLLLLNLAQEHVMRPPDRYLRVENGQSLAVHPAVRLNLLVLIVANSPQHYGESLKNLSKVIAFFQQNPLFTAAQANGLPTGLEQLVVELETLPLSEQHYIWSVLQQPYHPSVLYRVRSAVFADNAPVDAGVPITQIEQIHTVRYSDDP